MKPIAKINQFPYTVGGIKVNGAKINGVTYVDELYIFQQRSDAIYDLISSSGEIFSFITVTWKNEYGSNLDYYADSSVLVDTIKDNTFFWKVQDPREDIYGFMTLIHSHKIKVHNGKYIFRTEYQDVSLRSVRLIPEMIQANVGDIIEIDILFDPPDIENKKGNWILTNSNIVKALPALSNSTKQCYECLYEGAAYAVFVPDANKHLSGSSTVVVSEPVPSEVDYIMYMEKYAPSRNSYHNDASFQPGEIVTIRAINNNGKEKLPGNLTSSIKISGLDIGHELLTQIDTSDDHNLYMYQVSDSLLYNGSADFAWGAEITLSGFGLEYKFKLHLLPFMKLTKAVEIAGPKDFRVGDPKRVIAPYELPQYGVAWVSSDPSVISIDTSSGMANPLKEGTCTLSCYHANADGTPNLNSKPATRTARAMENIPTAIHYFPNDRFTYEIGEEIQMSYELVPSGSVLPGGIESWKQRTPGTEEYVTISETGVIKPIAYDIYNNDYYFNYNYFSVVDQAYYVPGYWLNYDAGRFGIGVVPKGTVIKPEYFYLNLDTQIDNNKAYTVLPLSGDPIQFSATLYPVLTTGDKSAIIEVDDPSIMEITYDSVGMNNLPGFDITGKALKKGRTVMTITSVQDPSIKYTRRIYVV